MIAPVVRVQREDFDPGAEIDHMQRTDGIGAVASFVGAVRSNPERPLASLMIDYYPAMTQAAIDGIAAEAARRFSIEACTIIHRFGTLLPGERIVFVAAASAHRRAALEATAFLIDWLKTKAPFWKRERYLDGGAQWMEAAVEDAAAAVAWDLKIQETDTNPL